MKRLLILVAILSMSVSMYAQRKLTLEESIAIALNKNVALIKQKNNLETSKENVKASYGNLLPSLNVSSGFNWNYSKISSTIMDFFGQPQEFNRTTQSRGYSMGASSSITLFDGLSTWARIYQSEDNLEQAKLSIEKAKQDIVYSTSDYFYSIISGQEAIKVSEENLNYNKKMLEQIVEKNKLGSAALADVYTWQYNVGNAELNLITAKNNLEKAKLTFLNYLSLSVMEEYEFVSPNPTELSPGTDVDNINTLINEALATRNDYKAQLLTLSSVKRGVTSAFSGYLPRLGASGSFGTNSTDPSLLFKNQSFSFGLNLSWSIFSNFSTELSLQQAQVNVLNAEEDTRALERQVKIDVKQAILDYQAARKSYDVAMANLKSAEESKKINVEKYNNGAATILDVMNSDNAYLSAAYGKINQQFQLYRTKDRLMNVLGKLDYRQYESK